MIVARAADGRHLCQQTVTALIQSHSWIIQLLSSQIPPPPPLVLSPDRV